MKYWSDGMRHSVKRRQARPFPQPPPYNGPRATSVRVSRRRLVVELRDGRTLVVPLALIPGFDQLPRRALSAYELIGDGIGIHFPAIDDDVSVENLLHPELTMWPATLPSVAAPSPPRARRRHAGART